MDICSSLFLLFLCSSFDIHTSHRICPPIRLFLSNLPFLFPFFSRPLSFLSQFLLNLGFFFCLHKIQPCPFSGWVGSSRNINSISNSRNWDLNLNLNFLIPQLTLLEFFVTMGNWGFLYILILFLLVETPTASVQNVGKMDPGFKGSQMYWIDNDGLFLLSNSSQFGFGLTTTSHDVTLFLLVVIHKTTSTVVWTANSGSPISNSDPFQFDNSGNAYLEKGGSTIWSTDTANKGVVSIQLWDSGNLVLMGKDGNPVWQSFSHPTNTLLSNQELSQGMKLTSVPSSNNITFSLEIKSGDMILSAGFKSPQPYWSVQRDSRIVINKGPGQVASATMSANSWKFYDVNKVLLSQFIFSDDSNGNATWVAVLGNDGSITFSQLSDSSNPSSTRIPADQCSRPAACNPYFICSGNTCQCPPAFPSCSPGTFPSCKNQTNSVNLVSAGDHLTYFALGFVQPSSKTTLDHCKELCLGNCSCGALFFQSSSGNCFLFSEIGSMEEPNGGSGYASFIKVSTSAENSGGGGSDNKHFPVVVIIVIVTVIVILGLLGAGFHIYRKNKKAPESPKESSGEEDNFLEGLSGMPVRFTYKALQAATNDFNVKLGQGGFGSVYHGSLSDGTQLAVKKLEGIGQGRKEFRAEVSIIGSIHHLHLVRLKGFCAEGSHRLLAYEYLANGSLDKWLFRKDRGEFMLDWNTRYNIAVGTAKGLAYLHEDCDAKIVHCDIKPENVLLDDHFMAKVSDFGLAKLMTREQSHVFTTLRGTRGYLAPEWITNYAISEKSDVYSYGMVLLELIGGRKNYDPAETSEKSHFPSYAFKMLEEGKVKNIVDSQLKMDTEDERVDVAIKVALWCIQDDMHLRPPMTKVVQMLEGLSPVPPPPTASQLGSRLYSTFFKSISEEGTSSGPSDCNSDAYLSAVRLSGPR